MLGFVYSPEQVIRYPPFIHATYGLGTTLAILVCVRVASRHLEILLVAGASTAILIYTERYIKKEIKFMETRVYCPGRQPTFMALSLVLVTSVVSCAYVLVTAPRVRNGPVAIYMREFVKSCIFLNLAAAVKCFLLGWGITDLRTLRRGLFGLIERVFLLTRAVVLTFDWTEVLRSFALTTYLGIKLVFMILLLGDFWGASYAFAKAATPVYTRTTPLDDEDCPICYCPPENAVALRCNHVFCQLCIDQWLVSHRTCPKCNRIAVTAQEIEFKDGSFPSAALLACF